MHLTDILTDTLLLALILCVSLFVVTTYVYLKTTPRHIDMRFITIYNSIIFAFSFLACLMIYKYAYLNNGLSVERAILSLLAYLQSLFTISAILLLGGLFRNLIMFRKKNEAE